DHASTGTRTRVTRVLVEEALPDAPALAVLFTLDGAAGRGACAVGATGGAYRPGGDRSEMDALAIDPATGFNPHHARNLAHRLGLGGAQAAALGRCLAALYEAVIALDATRIEIDPLLTHESRGVVAVGIAMTVDDAALFRHPEIMALREYDQEDEVEREAERHGLNYMRLEGSIGCLSHGAGVGIATEGSPRLFRRAPAKLFHIGRGGGAEA